MQLFRERWPQGSGFHPLNPTFHHPSPGLRCVWKLSLSLGTSGSSGLFLQAWRADSLWRGRAGLHLSKYWFLQQRHQCCQKLLQHSESLKDHKQCKCHWVLLWKLEGACPHSRSSWHMEFVWASCKGSLSPAGSVQSGWHGCLSSESHLYSTFQHKALHANVLGRFWQAASYWYPLCLSP